MDNQTGISQWFGPLSHLTPAAYRRVTCHRSPRPRPSFRHTTDATPASVDDSAPPPRQFTPAAIMQRIEPGKVKLEAPVKTYLPGLPEASIEQCDAGCARI